jgi:hypothetical protein
MRRRTAVKRGTANVTETYMGKRHCSIDAIEASDLTRHVKEKAAQTPGGPSTRTAVRTKT